eukprot:6878996-Prymnesium_polylepis.1
MRGVWARSTSMPILRSSTRSSPPRWATSSLSWRPHSKASTRVRFGFRVRSHGCTGALRGGGGGCQGQRSRSDLLPLLWR